MPTPRQYVSQAERQAAYRRRLAAARSQELAAKRVPPLPAVATIPGYSRWEALTRSAALLLETVQAEMQEYYEQRSDPWQGSERGEAFLERLEAVREAQAAAAELGG
jgi:hypothetical protein